MNFISELSQSFYYKFFLNSQDKYSKNLRIIVRFLEQKLTEDIAQLDYFALDSRYPHLISSFRIGFLTSQTISISPHCEQTRIFKNILSRVKLNNLNPLIIHKTISILIKAQSDTVNSRKINFSSIFP